MPSLDVKVFHAEDEEPFEFNDVDYVQFVNDQTYGPPALIGGGKDEQVELPAKVLFVSPRNSVAVQIVRHS